MFGAELIVKTFCALFHFSTGIEPTGNTVGTPAHFKVETFSAGRGDVDVRITNPRGAPEQVNAFAEF